MTYINDLPNCLDSTTPGMYADDTQITAKAETVAELEHVLNLDVKNLSEWLCANKLSANSTKTEFMTIASDFRLKQILTQPNIKLGNNTIKRVSKAKLLGMLVDEKLSWDLHINEKIIPKVLKGLRILRVLRETLNISQLMLVYNGLIMPHFDYCSTVWGNCGTVLKSKLQKLQNRAARIITRSGYEIRSKDILTKLKWNDLESRRVQQKATLMYQTVNDENNSNLNDIFSSVSSTHHYNLRDSNVNLKIPKPRTEFLKRSLAYSGPTLWNSLPSVIKLAPSVHSFKNNIKDLHFNF